MVNLKIAIPTIEKPGFWGGRNPESTQEPLKDTIKIF
jgi:hypothetical protein